MPFIAAPLLKQRDAAKTERELSRRLSCSAKTTEYRTWRDVGPLRNVRHVGCGTWSWGNRLLFGYDPSQDQALQEAFDAAVARGCTLFDTGDSYGTGSLDARAEILLGKFLRESPVDTSRLVIASKAASYPWRITRGMVANAVRRSSERLGRPVDIAQIHWSTAKYAPWQERALWDGMADSVERGYCKAVGVSNYGPEQLARVYTHLTEERGVPLATCQTQLSLLHRYAAEPGGLIEVAKERGVEVIGYSPLCLGVLSGKYTIDGRMPAELPRRLLFSRLLRGSPQLQQALVTVAATHDCTVAQVAISWCLSKGIIVISGVRNAAQACELMACSEVFLSDAEIRLLEASASQATSKMVRNVFETA